MVTIREGSVVKSIAGRDKERYYVVVSPANDGKVRKLEHPKKKNIRHVWPTEGVIPLGPETTNRQIRTILSGYNDGTSICHED
mgnify:FL=1